MYRFFADVLVVVHFLFILFVVAGGMLILYRPRMAFLHLPAVIWGAAVELCGWICPLTPLENYFRRIAGDAGYSGGFIEHYLVPLIYPENLTAEIQYILGGLVIVVNLIFYFILWRRIKVKQQKF
jgi:hypothetical protein